MLCVYNHKSAFVNLVSWAPETVAWAEYRRILDFEILRQRRRLGGNNQCNPLDVCRIKIHSQELNLHELSVGLLGGW